MSALYNWLHRVWYEDGAMGWLLVPWLGVDALRPAAWGARPILELAGVVADWPTPPGWMIPYRPAPSRPARPGV